jgi:hypothetical protein
MLRPSPRRSYYIRVFRGGDPPDSWRWEILRRRRPMGVRLGDGGFPTHHAAQMAGKQALEDFLNGLSIDAGARSFS